MYGYSDMARDGRTCGHVVDVIDAREQDLAGGHGADRVFIIFHQPSLVMVARGPFVQTAMLV